MNPAVRAQDVKPFPTPTYAHKEALPSQQQQL
jgi:hypothetical protein